MLWSDLQYWDKAFMYAIHIRSLTLISGLKDIVPYEAWTGHKPNISHFCIFGSLGWAHVPKQVRKGKPESRVVKFSCLDGRLTRSKDIG